MPRCFAVLLACLCVTGAAAGKAGDAGFAPVAPWAIGTPLERCDLSGAVLDDYDYSDPPHGQYVYYVYADKAAARWSKGQRRERWTLYFFDGKLACFDQQVLNRNADDYQRRRNALIQTFADGQGWVLARGAGRNYPARLTQGGLEISIQYCPHFNPSSCFSDGDHSLTLVQYGPVDRARDAEDPPRAMQDFLPAAPGGLFNLSGWEVADLPAEKYSGAHQAWSSPNAPEDYLGTWADLKLLDRTYADTGFAFRYYQDARDAAALEIQPSNEEAALVLRYDLLRELHARGWRLCAFDPQEAWLVRGSAQLRLALWSTDCICGMDSVIEIQPGGLCSAP